MKTTTAIICTAPVENIAKNAIMETSESINELLREILSLNMKEREELLAKWRAANV